jgi:thiamine-monophosphate kinase
MAPGEFERIRWLRAAAEGAPVRGGSPAGRLFLGIGDDAALWSPPSGEAAVLTVDAQVEGIHFRRGWLTAGQIGARAVATSASDLAAMAARPGGVLLAMFLPPDTEERFFRDLFRGAANEARRAGLAILGGNLSAGPLAVSVTSVGSARPERAVGRRGARPGDGAYVTGWPGRSRIGRALLEAAGGEPRASRRARGACLRAFRTPRARLAEARYLAERVRPRSMIDVSDGVAQDLGHLLEEGSRRGRALGAVLELSRLAALLEEGGCGALARSLGLDPSATALSGGEDYELLLSAEPEIADRAAREFRRRFGIPLTRIGTVVPQPGLRSEDGRPIHPPGFDHFGE